MNRRELLAGSLALPLLAAATRLPASVSGGPRRLLLIELNGGNDGLNTIVPGRDDLYPRLRPGLAVDASTLLPLDAGLGLNPAAGALHDLWARGELAVVQGLGYARANRSHFRSIEIWDTATDPEVTGTRGWLAGLDPVAVFGRPFTAAGIVIGRNPAALSGGARLPVVMRDGESFAAQARQLPDTSPADPAGSALHHILRVQSEIRAAGAALGAPRPRPQGDFPPGAFGRAAAEAATLLSGEPVAPVVKIALTGFDTHANQRARHDRLLGELGRVLAALRTAFVDYGVWDDVLVMTYSEFGRRAAANGSGGTDHGKAAPHFVLGGRVRGGLHGVAPRLDALEDGDVPATLDFRQLYNTVLLNWWSAPGLAIEPARFPPLALVS
jgi:uncharacterized protein (DUF1501 family)